MVGLKLLADAHAAGLQVNVVGNKLLILGPRLAEPIAKQLLANKAEVISLIAGNGSTDTDTSPPKPEENDPCVSVSGVRSPSKDDGWGPIAPGERLVDASAVIRCPRCNSLEKWWPEAGEPRCQICDPPTVSGRLIEKVENIRKRQCVKTKRRHVEPNKPHCRRCFSTQFVNSKIHGGRSIRRDCALCGHTAGFPVWFGQINDRFEAR